MIQKPKIKDQPHIPTEGLADKVRSKLGVSKDSTIEYQRPTESKPIYIKNTRSSKAERLFKRYEHLVEQLEKGKFTGRQERDARAFIEKNHAEYKRQKHIAKVQEENYYKYNVQQDPRRAEKLKKRARTPEEEKAHYQRVREQHRKEEMEAKAERARLQAKEERLYLEKEKEATLQKKNAKKYSHTYEERFWNAYKSGNISFEDMKYMVTSSRQFMDRGDTWCYKLAEKVGEPKEYAHALRVGLWDAHLRIQEELRAGREKERAAQREKERIAYEKQQKEEAEKKRIEEEERQKILEEGRLEYQRDYEAHPWRYYNCSDYDKALHKEQQEHFEELCRLIYVHSYTCAKEHGLKKNGWRVCLSEDSLLRLRRGHSTPEHDDLLKRAFMESEKDRQNARYVLYHGEEAFLKAPREEIDRFIEETREEYETLIKERESEVCNLKARRRKGALVRSFHCIQRYLSINPQMSFMEAYRAHYDDLVEVGERGVLDPKEYAFEIIAQTRRERKAGLEPTTTKKKRVFREKKRKPDLVAILGPLAVDEEHHLYPELIKKYEYVAYDYLYEPIGDLDPKRRYRVIPKDPNAKPKKAKKEAVETPSQASDGQKELREDIKEPQEASNDQEGSEKPFISDESRVNSRNVAEKRSFEGVRSLKGGDLTPERDEFEPSRAREPPGWAKEDEFFIKNREPPS
jgi:hypothetical protein